MGDAEHPAPAVAVDPVEHAELVGPVPGDARLVAQGSQRGLGEGLVDVQERAGQRPAPGLVLAGPLVQEDGEGVVGDGQEGDVDRDGGTVVVGEGPAGAGRTVFPVFTAHAAATRGYDTRTDTLTVAERAGSAVVEELVVTNEGVRPVLVLEGELLEGGQQHRVAARSALVAPDTSVVLPVRCVEQGRWSGGRAHVRAGRRAPVTVRSAQGQAEVWRRVARYGAGATGSLPETVGRREARAAALVAGLRPLPFQNGVLIGIGGQPVLLEVFDSPRTLADVWDALLQAVALDAVTAPAIPTPGRRARRFTGRVAAIDTVRGIDESGTVHEQGESHHARVTTLRWRDRAVHTSAVSVRHELVTA
nr:MULTISPECIES: DUF6569 family protein [unclassified Pseudonocardia]